MKNRWIEKTAAVLCAICLAVGVMSGVVFAGEEGSGGASGEIAYPEATFVVVEEASEEADAGEVTDNRNVLPLVVNGEAACACVLIDGVPFVRPAELLCALGLNDISFEATVGMEYFVCNGRYFYVDGGVPSVGGEMRLPVESLAECLGITVVWDRVQWTMSVETDGDVCPVSGEDYYDDTDLYWLSRVIYAEAGNQSLEGQIAAGNVVLHRVADDAFEDQNTVYDVVFAKNQFDVAANGMIYMEPSESAVIAAKIALEGCEVVPGATYFATFDFGEGYECVAWIGDHCFMTAA